MRCRSSEVECRVGSRTVLFMAGTCEEKELPGKQKVDVLLIDEKRGSCDK